MFVVKKLCDIHVVQWMLFSHIVSKFVQ